ncbi:MAG: DUF2520 domain-containing protein [Flavobacteriales bacterium]|nr:DUF2520 domain-containing protein [Flavobacteriales bacterium]
MIKNITIIGSGNVATHLGKALLNKGFCINQVYSNSIDNAFELASTLNAMPCDDIKFITDESDLYLVCIKDDFIEEIVKQLCFKNKIVVHTSGSIAMSVLASFNNYGIFYPLQTFSKNAEVIIAEVPFCIEANNECTQKILLELAKVLSNNVYEINSEQRKKIHVAAVFACNFSNYMYTISENILNQNNIDFDILKPLILETAKKTQHNSPKNIQTGPAKRNDDTVINNHLEMLSNNKGYQEIYRLMSDAISNSANNSE